MIKRYHFESLHGLALSVICAPIWKLPALRHWPLGKAPEKNVESARAVWGEGRPKRDTSITWRREPTVNARRYRCLSNTRHESFLGVIPASRVRVLLWITHAVITTRRAGATAAMGNSCSSGQAHKDKDNISQQSEEWVSRMDGVKVNPQCLLVKWMKTN